MNTELTDYVGWLEEFPSPNFARHGYKVTLKKREGYLDITMTYNDDGANRHVDRRTVALYRGKSPRQFTEVVNEVIYKAVQSYNDHNQTLGNNQLLKALEDRLNGSAEMLVLTPAPAPVEDDRGIPIYDPDTKELLGYYQQDRSLHETKIVQDEHMRVWAVCSCGWRKARGHQLTAKAMAKGHREQFA